MIVEIFKHDPLLLQSMADIEISESKATRMMMIIMMMYTVATVSLRGIVAGTLPVASHIPLARGTAGSSLSQPDIT